MEAEYKCVLDFRDSTELEVTLDAWLLKTIRRVCQHYTHQSNLTFHWHGIKRMGKKTTFKGLDYEEKLILGKGRNNSGG